jgi:hypothetical protein
MPRPRPRLGATWVERDALLAQSDFVVVMAPYSSATHHLIGAAEIAKMKPTAILVNSARGGVVDDAALAAALKEKAHRRRRPRRLRGRTEAQRRILDAPERGAHAAHRQRLARHPHRDVQHRSG